MSETTPPADAAPPDEPPPDKPLTDRPLTESELAEAREYGRRELRWELIGRGASLAYLLPAVGLLFYPHGPLVSWIESLTPVATLQLLLLFLLFTAGETLLSLPLAYFGGHRLEHAYGLSRQSFGAWCRKQAKQIGLGTLLGAALLVGLYWVIWLVGGWWWLVAAAGFFLVSVVFGQLAPVVILPLFYKIERLEDDEQLTPRMQRLTGGTGLSIAGIYRMRLSDETVKANAMLAGLGKTRRVILGDTLLDNFTADEIEVIFAHEVGHHVHRHIHKLIALGVAVGGAGFFLAHLALEAWVGRFQQAAVDFTQLPPWSLPMLLLVIGLFSTLVEPLQNAVSRHFERQSDRYALEHSGLPEAYRSAFTKLARLNKDDPDPHPWEVLLLHSHPPIKERLALAGTPDAGIPTAE